MESFTNSWMPYINLIITLLVGSGLGLIIRHKNSLISTLTASLNSTKEMLSIYDVNQFKQYSELVKQNLEMKHQQDIKKAIDKTFEESKDVMVKSSMPLIEKYNELVDLELHYMLSMTDENLERYLNLLPKNKEFLKEIIAKINGGEIRPTN